MIIKIPLFLILIFALQPSWAQEGQTAKALYNAGMIETVDSSHAKSFALQHLPNLQKAQANLQLIDHRKSPYSHHYTFEQVFDGIPVYGSQVKVNVNNEGEVFSLFDNSYETRDWPAYGISNTVGDMDAVELLNSAGLNPGAQEIEWRKEIYYVPGEGFPVAVVRASVYDPGNASYYEYLVTDEGKILLENDLSVRFMPQDSLVAAYVFNPDPLTTANQAYGGLYQDFDDADTPALNDERQAVQMVVQFDNGEFQLTNDVVKIVDQAKPDHDPATSTVPVFDFLRGNDNFEDVNAYYHIWNFNRYINTTLGFEDLATFQLRVDARGNEDDNSYFVSTDPPRIFFGIGGVDDAEDADVVIHEYGHAISYSAAPGTNAGFERQALDEGFGDYLAASYSRNLEPYRWGDVFIWDGHNEFWKGRVANNSRFYPDDLNKTSIYSSGEIWSSALMEIWEELGREVTDEMVILSMYSYTQNMGMQDAGQLLLQTEQQVSGGAHFTTVYSILLNRGLVPEIENSIVGSLDFLEENGEIAVFLSEGAKGSIISVYNSIGQLVGQVSGINEKVYFLPREWFTASGVYIVEAQVLGNRFSGKVVYMGGE